MNTNYLEKLLSDAVKILTEIAKSSNKETKKEQESKQALTQALKDIETIVPETVVVPTDNPFSVQEVKKVKKVEKGSKKVKMDFLNKFCDEYVRDGKDFVELHNEIIKVIPDYSLGTFRNRLHRSGWNVKKGKLIKCS